MAQPVGVEPSQFFRRHRVGQGEPSPRCNLTFLSCDGAAISAQLAVVTIQMWVLKPGQVDRRKSGQVSGQDSLLLADVPRLRSVYDKDVKNKNQDWKMNEIGFVHRDNWREGRTMLNATIALSIGALLGVLVVMPYDQLIGLPVPTCTVLRAVVSVAFLGGLNIGRIGDLAYKTGDVQGTRGALGNNDGRLNILQCDGVAT